MDDQTELLELERRRCSAISAGDIASLEALLSDDYVHVHMTAMVDDRAGHLAGVAKRPRTTTRGEILVRVYGDLAVLTGELSNQMAAPGQEPRAVRAYCHQVAVRTGGSWRFVSAQLTPLKVS
jgi:ketosteroid isomerase-like protein